ncbi:MAG: ATP-binding protein [Candidatus Micrarchaeota archaeon]
MIPVETMQQVVRKQRADLEMDEKDLPRQLTKGISPDADFATVISGVRRGGKSTLLRQLAKRAKKFHYTSFEDSRLAGFEAQDFHRLEEVLTEEFGPAELCLFDEVQNIKGWERYVSGSLGKGKKFVLTGSNASLLSKELGTLLTGRHLTYELFPFSYSEFLSFRGIKADAASAKRYLREGGFPAYLKKERDEVLQELLADILSRDIMTRYPIRDGKLLKDMALHLVSNVGKEFSYNRLRKVFDAGSTNSITQYGTYLEDSYLFFYLPGFDYSPAKQLVAPKKAYCIDNGLARANSLSFSADEGRMLENAVFLALRRQGKELYYYKEEAGECDFLLKQKGRISSAVQVCHKMEDSNRQREIDGLVLAMKKFRLDEGTIVTLEQEDHFGVDGRKVKMVPAWKWMTEKADEKSG